MPKEASLTIDNNILYLTGELDFCNVMTVYEKSLSLFKRSPELLIDFSKLVSSNSAGLALIIEWIKLSKDMQKPIQFKHLSPQLLSVIKAANLDKLMVV